jgi:hypothetical protein
MDGEISGLPLAAQCLEGAIVLLTRAADEVGKFEGAQAIHEEASIDLALDQCRTVKAFLRDRIFSEAK